MSPMVSSGVYDIVVQKDGVSVCVGKYDNKGSFGELALMYNTPRAATIIATQEGFLWALVSQTETDDLQCCITQFLRKCVNMVLTWKIHFMWCNCKCIFN